MVATSCWPKPFGFPSAFPVFSVFNSNISCRLWDPEPAEPLLSNLTVYVIRFTSWSAFVPQPLVYSSFVCSGGPFFIDSKYSHKGVNKVGFTNCHATKQSWLNGAATWRMRMTNKRRTDWRTKKRAHKMNDLHVQCTRVYIQYIQWQSQMLYIILKLFRLFSSPHGRCIHTMYRIC